MLGELQRMLVYKRLNPNELSEQEFLALEKEIKKPKKELISDVYLDFKLWQNGLPSRQESFAKYLLRKLPKDPGAKILEVGCGRRGRLSRILGERGFCITGIDTKIEMESYENVKFLKEKFNYEKFNLLEYDFVIAQEPCDATEHIVRACIKQKVPFIISLCGAPHKMISGYMPKNEKEWYELLVKISVQDLKLRYIKTDPITETLILKSTF